MSIARHHAEWLSLVPVSGPFLSLPVLMEAFNTGLEPHEPEHVRLLRQEYANWQESCEKRRTDPAPHHHWVRFVLSRTLDLDERVLLEGQVIPQTLQVEIPEHHEFLRPTLVVNDPGSNKPRMLIQVYPRSQDLSSYVAGSSWKASPDTRMTELLHGTGVRLGIVTNGEHWMLVDAPKGETTGYASWFASLWLEEPITLRAFRSLLSASRFFNVPDDQTLESLLAKSASNQQEVTDQLGYQVRRAVEVLIYSLDRADQDFGRELLADVMPEQLYESALTVMMRLVFLFCAEERELIPSKPFPVYEQNYSVSTISKQLRELADQHGEELLERRHDAWPRLLAAFRAVYGGLKHDDVHIPAYGGNLFNPDRFPFLEGRKRGTSWKESEANPLPVNNRTVLHLLEALQLLQIKVPGGGPAEARRLSFRALDIEQIGHVYEGLLDHTAKRAAEPFLGLAGTRDKEPELPLARLEELMAKGEAELVKFLKDETGKSDKALQKSLKVELDKHDVARFRTACQSDDALWKRVEPLAGLVRQDNFGYPVVIPKGSVFVTTGTDRRSSGTHYTPRSLTEPIVQYTLEPLVYVGPAEGKPKGEWKLKSAKELLGLKICDMACGSGAFLVQAARYMAERLLEAWDNAKKANPNTPGITPEGSPSAGRKNEALIPDDPAERKTYAMRIIAQRCLYGVDINPLAAEMAKLSLWLLTLAKDKPFEFLDHSIRWGDSLVGLHSIDQLRHYSLKPAADDAVLFKGPLDTAVDEAINLRLKLEDMPANTVEEVRDQETLLIEANERIARLRCAADLLVSAEFWVEGAKEKLQRVRHYAEVSGQYIEKGPTEEFEAVAREAWLPPANSSRFSPNSRLRPFHWPLEFPEVMVNRGGFDAFIGKPPFMKGHFISRNFGERYRGFVVAAIIRQSAGLADLVAFFFARAASLIATDGAYGFLATNSISDSDTNVAGIDSPSKAGVTVYRADQDIMWPGAAGVVVTAVWLYRGRWLGECWLDGKSVPAISPQLNEGRNASVSCLARNADVAFNGSYLLGDGYEVPATLAQQWLDVAPQYEQVILRYINGKELFTYWNELPVRWAICFWDWPEARAAEFPMAYERLLSEVKPVRDTVNRERRRKLWWIHAENSPGLYHAVGRGELFEKHPKNWQPQSAPSRVICKAKTSRTWAFTYLPATTLFDQSIVVFVSASTSLFTQLQSSIHEEWAIRWGSTLKTDMSYTSSAVFETYPLLDDCKLESKLGESYYNYRQELMRTRKEGLTKTYNRFHDPDESSIDILKLRSLHIEIDQAVASAYGWTDLELDHGHHETKEGVRFTISEPARREVLQRLLKLNHERYAEEVKQGLHGKKGATKKTAPKKTGSSAKQMPSLFDGEE